MTLSPKLLEGGGVAPAFTSSNVPSCTQVTSLVNTGLFRDVLSMYDADKGAALLAVHLGAEVSGHVGILHGGIMTMLCEEVFAVAVKGLQRTGVLGGGPSGTGNLTLNFRKVPSILAAARWMVSTYRSRFCFRTEKVK